MHRHARAAHGGANAIHQFGMALMMSSQVGGRALSTLGGAMMVTFGMGTIGLIAGATAAVVGLGRGMLGNAADTEVFRARFETLLRDVAQGNALFEELQEFADHTPFSDPATFRGAEKLLNFGFQARDIIPIMTDLGDAVGADEERFGRAALALGQMQAKGRASMEEINQLTEAGIPAFAILAEKLGLSQKAMQNLGAAGIESERAIAAIREGIRERFGGGMERAAQTTTGLVSNLIAAGRRLLTIFGTGLDPVVKPLISFLISGLTQAQAAAKALVAGPLWQRFVDALLAAGRAAAPLFRALGRLGFDALTLGLRVAAVALNGIGAALQWIGRFLKPVIDLFGSLWQRFKQIDWGGLWQTLKDNQGKLAEELAMVLLDLLDDAWAVFRDGIVPGAQRFAHTLIQGIIDWIRTNPVEAIGAALVFVLVRAIGGLTATSFAGLGVAAIVAAEIQRDVRARNWGGVADDVAAGLGAALILAFGGPLSIPLAIIFAIAAPDIIATVRTQVGNALDEAWRMIQQRTDENIAGLRWNWLLLQHNAGELWGSLTAAVDEAWETTKGTVETQFDAIAAWIRNVWYRALDLAADVRNRLGEIYDAIATWSATSIEAVGTAIGNVGTAIAGGFWASLDLAAQLLERLN